MVFSQASTDSTSSAPAVSGHFAPTAPAISNATGDDSERDTNHRGAFGTHLRSHRGNHSSLLEPGTWISGSSQYCGVFIPSTCDPGFVNSP